MIKKISILIICIIIMQSGAFATTLNTVITNVDKVPVQESNNSAKVIYLIPNATTLTKVESQGDFYKIKLDDVEGYISKVYTSEGVAELEASSFVKIAAERKQYVRDNRYTYKQSGPIVPADASKKRVTDCSAYVSDVIYHYAKSKNWTEMMKIGRKSSHYFNGIGKNLKKGKTNSFFTLVPSIVQAQPGDILCYNGHVEIYAGGSSGSKPKVYNCGSTSAIRSSSLITTSSKSKSKLTYILRVK